VLDGTINIVSNSISKRLSFWSTNNTVSENAYIQSQNDGATTNTGEIIFATKNTATSLAERVRITAEGRLGIGSSAPSQLLQVQKDQAAATFARIDNQSSSSSAYAGVQLGAYGNTWGLAVGSSSANSNALVFVLDPNTSISGGEKMRLDSSGRLLVGTANARDNFFNAVSGNAWQFQVEGTDYKNSCASFTSNTTSAGDGPHLILARSRGPAIGSNAIVSSASGGDILGLISFQGADGSKFVEGARISAFVDGTPGSADMPGRLVFSVTRAGASSPTEAMQINNDRDVFIGTTTINPGIGNTTRGVMIRGGAGGNGNYVAVSRDGGTSLFVNRSTSDGTLVDFNQDGTTEGSISVSGTAV
jgi:hypothetical protein